MCELRLYLLIQARAVFFLVVFFLWTNGGVFLCKETRSSEEAYGDLRYLQL
jgi:hypothetical protein